MSTIHTVDELSALFDNININENLDEVADYGVTEKEAKKLRSFEDCCTDVHLLLKPDDETLSEINEKIEIKAVEIKLKPVKKIVSEVSESIVDKTPESLPVNKKQDENDDINPLDLSENDLSAFNKIKDKYPQFELYDGSQAYKGFYKFKVRVLKSLLTEFPVLRLNDMRQEIESIKTKFKLPDNFPEPYTIAMKIGECQSSRGRVTELLMQSHSQLPLWKKSYELLNSKLWKDHDIKGAHKREGLALEYNFDIYHYYYGLQGFVDAATILDNYLKSVFESLSRQMSCIMIKDKISMVGEAKHFDSSVFNNTKIEISDSSLSSDSSLDNFDTLDEGTIMSKVRKGGLIEKSFSGPEINSDFLDNVG